MEIPTGINEARIIQNALIKKIRITPLKSELRFIAGVDASYTETHVITVAALFTYPELEHITDSHAIREIPFPYVPGFLSFREGPSVIDAIRNLSPPPDVIMFDGQGIAHPHRMGIATHMGIILNIPTIGCAKSRLVGTYKEPGLSKGHHSSLIYKNRGVGSVLRTRENVQPIFVSPGHLIDNRGSLKIVLHCVRKYRIPLPIRRADACAKELKKEVPLSCKRH